MPHNKDENQNKKANSFNVDFSYDGIKSLDKNGKDKRHHHRAHSSPKDLNLDKDYQNVGKKDSLNYSFKNKDEIRQKFKTPSPISESNDNSEIEDVLNNLDKKTNPKDTLKRVEKINQPYSRSENPFQKSMDHARMQKNHFVKHNKSKLGTGSSTKQSLSLDSIKEKVSPKDNSIDEKVLIRRKRIAELEKMQSTKEVEQSFQQRLNNSIGQGKSEVNNESKQLSFKDKFHANLAKTPIKKEKEEVIISLDSQPLTSRSSHKHITNVTSDKAKQDISPSNSTRKRKDLINKDKKNYVFINNFKEKINLNWLNNLSNKAGSFLTGSLVPLSKGKKKLDSHINSSKNNRADSLSKDTLVNLLNPKSTDFPEKTSDYLAKEENKTLIALNSLSEDPKLYNQAIPSPKVQKITTSIEKQDPKNLNWQERYVIKRREKRQKQKQAYTIRHYSFLERLRMAFDIFINVFKRLALIILGLLILLGLFAGGTGIGYFAALVNETNPPSYQEMAEDIARLEQQSTLYYGSGEPIASVRSDVVRSIASLEEISPNIIRGLIAIEDEEFFEHPGVNPKATLRAVLQTLVSGSGTGGSTLTQQLVKQQMLTNEVTYFRKANEILLALRLENFFTKDEILTAYLNVSPFGRNNNGDNIAGIREAAEGIFGVEPNEVNLAQAAYLVGLPQDPYNYTPYNQFGELRENIEAGLERKDNVLFSLYRNQLITNEQYEEALTYDITQDFLVPTPRDEERQSYLYQAIMDGAIEKIMHLNIQQDGFTLEQVYADDDWYNEYYFSAEEELTTGGYHVYSTIDREIYDQLQVSAQTHDDELGVVYDGIYVDPNTGEETYYLENVQTGMVVIENATGRVLGFVSGTDFENNQIDHAFNMHRSPGSTIKPMAVYAPAIEHDLITPATIIPDTEFVETYNDGSEWRPTNYGVVVSNDFISARTALLRSDNIPAVRVYEGIRNSQIPVIDYMQLMGFNTIDSYTEEDTMNLAFSLGGVTTGPTVFEQTRAFTTFANNGQYVDGYYIERIEDSFGNVVFQQNADPVRVFSEDTNYLVLDMLRDTNTEGTGRFAAENMVMSGDWIAKSGISENSKDVWYIASTPAITIGSWIGYDSQYYEHTIDINDGFGGESLRSQTFWANVVNDLYNLKPDIFGTDLTFSQPDSVREQSIVDTTGTLPGTIRTQNGTATVNGPMRQDLFKVSRPAPELTYDFMFNASDQDLQRFWSGLITSIQERRGQEQPSYQETNPEPGTDEETANDEESNPDEDGSDGDSNNDGNNGSNPPLPDPNNPPVDSPDDIDN